MLEPAKILVVGGGVIGRGCYEYLKYDHDIRVIDKRPDHSWNGREYFTHVEDFLDIPTVYLAGYDYCINTMPVYDPELVCKIVYACNIAKTHYLDFSEDVHAGDAIRREWSNVKPDILIAPHCGLAPGIVQIIANSLAKPFDIVDTIRMYVGALPLSTDNGMKYHASWSADGVINEYTNPSLVIQGGKTGYVPSLDGLRSVTICGKEYEAFFTSGGCATLPDTWTGRAETVEYRTVRYPGHLEYLQENFWPLILKSNTQGASGSTDAFRAKLEESKMVHDFTDTVVMFVTVSGVHGGETRCNQFSAEVKPFVCNNHKFQAIQRMTVGGMALIFDSHYMGNIKRTGILRQEEIDWDTIRKSRYFDLVF